MDAFIEDQKKKKRRSLAFFFASALLFGAADLFLYERHPWESISAILNAITGAIAIGLWCSYDAKMRGFLLHGYLRILIWLFAILGVPRYLVRSRGWAGAARIGFGLPAFLVSIGFYYAGWYAAYWIADKIGFFE